MSFWPHIDNEISTAIHVQKTILDTDIPDEAKRKVLQALDLNQPDNGMRLVLDIQYEFGDVEILRHSYASSLMTFLKRSIQDYKKKYQQNYVDGIIENKAITKIARVDLIDIEYCDTWFEEEDEDG